ncbi:MAG: MBL fold metallo-hydrolase [Chthoniobacterales bacterium]
MEKVDSSDGIRFEEFTGGPLDTNAFLIAAPGGNLLIDAPQGADAHYAGTPIHTLLLTHGHFDHVADAAAIQARHGCEVVVHADSLPMIEDREFFRRWGFGLEVDPVAGARTLAESEAAEFAGLSFRVLEVPGHCPGSLCFLHEATGTLFGGDVVFLGGVGRADLPGGDAELLLDGIRSKILTLPDATVILPGHGPATTVGAERLGNPWLK